MNIKWLLVGAAILFIPLSFKALHLFSSMSPELEELLPLTSPYLRDSREGQQRISGEETLTIWAECPDPKIGTQFQATLANRIRSAAIPGVHSVNEKVGPETEFFSKRMGLFLTPTQIMALNNEVQKLEPTSNNDKFDLRNFTSGLKKFVILQKIKERFSGFLDRSNRFKDGYFASKDGRIRLIILKALGTGYSLKEANDLQNKVDAIAQDLLREQPDYKSISIRYTGTIRHLIEEQNSLFQDVGISAALVMVLVLLCLIFYFSSLWDLIVLFTSLIFGVIAALALSSFFIHPMNANAAFMTSIVIGNGINFGIILLSRIRETGNITVALKQTRAPTLLAAFGGLVAYGSFAATEFRGFKQFGIVGMLGMLSCWATAMILIPALVKWKEGDSIRIWNAKGFTKKLPAANTKPFARVLITLILIACIGLWCWPKNKIQFEADLNKIRDKKSQETGSLALAHETVKIFGELLSPVVILTSTREKAKALAYEIQNSTSPEHRAAKFRNVLSLDTLIPDHQIERIEALKKLKKTIQQLPSGTLTPDQIKIFNRLTYATDMRPFTEADLPDTVIKAFTEKDGSKGRIILIESEGLREKFDLAAIQQIFKALDQDIAKIDPKAIVLGSASLVKSLVAAVQAESKKVTGWTFLLVVALLILFYRSATASAWILSSWVVGVFFFVTLILITQTKINIINFMAIPITVGIGVDYSANFYSRLRQQNLWDAFRAVLLCSSTTCIGYASLLVAGNMGLKGFAVLALFGELCCLFNALLWGMAWTIELNVKSI